MFAICFWGWCGPSGSSALSERVVVANGLIWSTEGGWLFDTNETVPNHSEVIAFNPVSKTTCSYIVPGNNNQLIGLAIVGSRPNSTVWFAESNVLNGDVYLDRFNPDAVGDGCPGTTNELYSIAGNMRQFPWPGAGAPAQIAVDPSLNALWVTDWLGSAIYRVDTTGDDFIGYALAPRNMSSAAGAIPGRW